MSIPVSGLMVEEELIKRTTGQQSTYTDISSIRPESGSSASSEALPPVIVVPSASQQADLNEQNSIDKEAAAASTNWNFTTQLLENSKLQIDEQNPSRHQPLLGNSESQLQESAVALSRVSWKPQGRRFTPQLIETSRRSRRAGDHSPTLTSSDRTDVISFGGTLRLKPSQPRDRPAAPLNTPLLVSPVIPTNEARKLGIPISRRTLSPSTGRFVSSLATQSGPLESPESELSETRSRSSSQSSLLSISFEHATRARESIDGDSSGYLLALAAKAAEQQLREQALAAFPNDDRHQPVHHYIDQDETPCASSLGSQYDLDVRRRDSTNWELKELQRHHEQLEAGREKEKQKRDARRRLYRKLDENPWAMPVLELQDGVDSGPTVALPCIKDNEMEKMRNRARPPMLGKDLQFPRCSSPDGARFDITQGSEWLRKQMCYLSEQKVCEELEEGLWSPQLSQTSPASQPSLWSGTCSRTTSKGGLWGGSCLESSITLPKGQTGIMTPCLEDENPLEIGDSSHLLRHFPPSPPPSNSGMANLDEKLGQEETIESEFDDSFVTQVYNYLSIGYPAIARDFDEELSKISGISVSELQQDDDLPGARGYIRLGEDEQHEDGVTEENCARWKALRLYIQEWARQQPCVIKSPSNVSISWNPARKGSWAW